LSEIDSSSLPIKKYYSISEVSTLLGIKQTEIRYWEKFEPKLRSKGITRAYDLKKLKLLIKIKKLIKDQGIKPVKLNLYLSNKNIKESTNLEIKKELINIKNLIKKASKV
jgi:DNA-binding transcriptional MerR regulator